MAEIITGGLIKGYEKNISNEVGHSKNSGQERKIFFNIYLGSSSKIMKQNHNQESYKNIWQVLKI